MQPKTHRHVLCAKNVITIQGHKTGGLFCPPPSEITDKTTPLFYILGSSVITLLVHKTCLYSITLHCSFLTGWLMPLKVVQY